MQKKGTIIEFSMTVDSDEYVEPAFDEDNISTSRQLNFDTRELISSISGIQPSSIEGIDASAQSVSQHSQNPRHTLNLNEMPMNSYYGSDSQSFQLNINNINLDLKSLNNPQSTNL